MTRASEKGLRLSSSDAAFANAMAQCQWPVETCMHLQYCQRGGDCFRSEKRAAMQAIGFIKAAMEDTQSPMVREHLKEAAAHIARTALAASPYAPAQKDETK